MSEKAASLGRCPACSGRIPSQQLLIEYLRGDTVACFAECPSCRDIVHPQ